MAHVGNVKLVLVDPLQCLWQELKCSACVTHAHGETQIEIVLSLKFETQQSIIERWDRNYAESILQVGFGDISSFAQQGHELFNAMI